MSFSFNFLGDKEKKETTSVTDKNGQVAEVDRSIKVKLLSFKDINQSCATEDNLRCLLTAKDISRAEVSLRVPNTLHRSDKLIAKDIYEGGGTLWECTLDLLNYLKDHVSQLENLKTIIEVGCGQGLPAIWSAMLNISVENIFFQDLNEDVIEQDTLSNIFLNKDTLSHIRNIKAFIGKWCDLLDSFNNEDIHKPCLILGSEILYDPTEYSNLCQLFQILLKNESSLLILATKRHYFGVGGGTQVFIDYATSFNRRFTFEKLICFEDGQSITRDIISCRLRSEK